MRRSICRHRGSVFPQTYAGLVAGLASTCLSSSRPNIVSPARPRRNISAGWFVAERLQDAGLATLLTDLLTVPEEERDQRTGRLRFDVALLGMRVVAILDSLAGDSQTAALPVGIFGASTGAAAALLAAAQRPRIVRAVVSRGGRPDLAAQILDQVNAPTLFIVGERDEEVLALNRTALAQLRVEKELAIVPGATHLFEESGTLEQVADLAAGWFQRHLVPNP